MVVNKCLVNSWCDITCVVNCELYINSTTSNGECPLRKTSKVFYQINWLVGDKHLMLQQTSSSLDANQMNVEGRLETTITSSTHQMNVLYGKSYPFQGIFSYPHSYFSTIFILKAWTYSVTKLNNKLSGIHFYYNRFCY